MTRRCLLVGIYCTALISASFAQDTVKGKVYASNDSVISGVNVFNRATRQSSRSGADGHYSVNASEGDVLIFSAAGYRSDTFTVKFSMLLTDFDATLGFQFISLKNVNVTNTYVEDSLARRQAYKYLADNRERLIGRSGPSNGVGVSMSPLSFLSQEAKRKRVLQKRLLKEERDAYIDHSFPEEWVARVTALTGDSLYLFMYRYRPSYNFCQQTDRSDMLLYINDKLKEFRKPKDD